MNDLSYYSEEIGWYQPSFPDQHSLDELPPFDSIPTQYEDINDHPYVESTYMETELPVEEQTAAQPVEQLEAFSGTPQFNNDASLVPPISSSAPQATFGRLYTPREELFMGSSQVPEVSQAPQQVSPTMEDYYNMVKQQEYLQYMEYLRSQHPGPGKMPLSPQPQVPQRSRSSSQPVAVTSPFSTLPAQMSLQGNDERERKVNKYRAKRVRRLTRTLPENQASCLTSTGNNFSDLMPAPKIQKTHNLDLENRLMSSEEECNLLRSALNSRDQELMALRLAFEDQQRQIAMLTDSASNASSSACTSPRPHSPSTPAMVSSPSSMSIGSTIETVDQSPYSTPSIETSSFGSDMLDTIAAEQRLQEKLKKLGGPPSDVYRPWWNGINLNHPAFQAKEDWVNFELRPQEMLAKERLDYLLTQQRYKLEQLRIAEASRRPSQQMARQMDSSHQHHPHSFYQSPHQSHIHPGSPAVNQGYWSGHFVPSSSTEKIDFSKIALRKTNSPPQQQTPSQHFSPLSPSANAAIWQDATEHPELYNFARPLSWINEQPDLRIAKQVSARAPFKRNSIQPSTQSVSSSRSSNSRTPSNMR